MITVVLSIFVVTFVVFWYIFKYEPDSEFERIPGPRGVPFIGNIGDLFCKEEERWHLTRKRASEYYPIYKMKIANKKIVTLLDPVDAEVILSNQRYITKGAVYDGIRDWLGNGVLFSTGESWRKSRKIFTKTFHFDALKSYVHLMNESTDYLKSVLEKKIVQPVEMYHFCNFQSLKVICNVLLGKQIKIEDKFAHMFIKSIKELTLISTLKVVVPLMNVLYKFTPLKKKEEDLMKTYYDFLENIMEENKQKIGKEDLPRFVKSLTQNYDGKGLRDELSTFVFAGQDTTSVAMNFFLYILGNQPHYQEEIYKEIIQTCGDANPTYAEIQQMNLFDRFIKECFRLYPPAHFIGRTLDENVELPSGYNISAGTNVLMQIYDIHRNPKDYPNPDVFDPDRFLPENSQKRHPYSFIPFSAGPRNCIAQKFAVLEITATLGGLLRKYKIKSVGSLEDIVFIPDLLLKSKHPLKVEFIPR